MSDTTSTITPKKKTILRDMQGCAMGWVPGTRLLGNSRAGEICTAIDQVLTALEAAEAALLKEEVYSEELESQLQHAREENEQLRAERDWLAENVADRPCAYDSCPFGLQRPTGPDYGCGKTHVQCWQKALTPRRG